MTTARNAESHVAESRMTKPSPRPQRATAGSAWNLAPPTSKIVRRQLKPVVSRGNDTGRCARARPEDVEK